MENNWAGFIKMAKHKARGHSLLAQYWDKVNSILTLVLIILSTGTTLCTLLPVPTYVASTFGAVTTLVAAVFSTLAPDHRRQVHSQSGIEFRSLMLKMVRVETDRHYEGLWKEYNKEMVVEPFLPLKYRNTEDTDFSMSPEFSLLVALKGKTVKEALKKYEVKVVVPDLNIVEIDEETAPPFVPEIVHDLSTFVEEKLAAVISTDTSSDTVAQPAPGPAEGYPSVGKNTTNKKKF